ncbi:MAG: hydrolase TatD [Candidatus Eremiobacter antarcticus]|nr:TatD family hydrolase [Candidatus Eremiobacteraeota bacterium]MBC5808009.1 TatD family hydrolase [Candidatus Eremiobacteraeota bacterium]PZR62634.1 MAG: hydrolase TatD [Candidatus Eremiobacter sp. RRmetagenome_bin22]
MSSEKHRLPDLRLIDTHAHLDGPEFEHDLDEVMQRAAVAGVAKVVCMGQDEPTSRAAISLTRRMPAVACAVGIHPHLAAGARTDWMVSLLAEALEDGDRVVAIGEVGLDYHYDFSERSQQRSLFADQLAIAAQHTLPVVIHCRKAYDDLSAILKSGPPLGAGAVVHCFTGSFELGERLIAEHDVYLGIGGAVTFKNARELQEAVKLLPLHRLVLETDCPYMTPVPYRGNRNEPAHVGLTCAAVASLRGMSTQDLAAQTTENALRLFPRLTASSV